MTISSKTHGWPTMMIVGVGYRLLPMVLPSKMPSGRSMYASAILLEVGLLGLVTLLVHRSPWTWMAAIMVVAGLGVFAGHVIWMVRHPAPRPVGAPRFDFAVGHAACAATSLVVAVVIGLALVIAPASSVMLRAAAAYGVLGLVGFLAQMVVAMEARLLPLVSWCWAYADSGYRVSPPSPYAMNDRWLQSIVLVGWVTGVPALAIGMALDAALPVGIGATTLLVAVVAGTLDNVRVVANRYGATFVATNRAA